MQAKTHSRGALTGQPDSQYWTAARLRQALNTDGARWRARLLPSTRLARLFSSTNGQREDERDQHA